MGSPLTVDTDEITEAKAPSAPDFKMEIAGIIVKNIPAKSSEEALYYFWTRPEHRRRGIIERAARIKVSDIKENLKYVEYDKPLGL